MNEKEIRALLEGAYAQTPTLPGFFVKYDEFRSRFNKPQIRNLICNAEFT
jgi:hypothetical protein